MYLATLPNPEDKEKDCGNWTDKALKAGNIWREGFDDLTGSEIAKLINGGSRKA